MSASASILKAIDPRTTKLNLMLIAVPLTCYFAYIPIGSSYNVLSEEQLATAAFFASMVAIMPLAFLMGRATEEIALQTSDSLGGLLNATFGNAAELIIALFAIIAAYEGITSGTEVGLETSKMMVHLVQASLIGSILGNLLLVMGLAFVWGGIHYEEQSFSQTQVSANGSLLLLAVMVLVVPTVFHSAVGGSEGASGVENLSHIAALVLLVLYVLFLLFQFKTHSHLFATEGGHDEEPTTSKKDAMILLILATIFVSWMAEILVGSVEKAAEKTGLPHLFIGVILLPLFGNAAEHFTAVSVAAKNKMDLSFAISMGSSTQIAVFVAPLMVVIAWALGVPLTFEFGVLETVAVFMAVMIVNLIAADGKSNWLEGAMLLGAYAVLGAAFLFHP